MYIDKKLYRFIPVQGEVKVNDQVAYQNLNGNWYQGTVTELEQWHDCLLSPRKKYGFIVDYGDISLIQERHLLFIALQY
jgi:hypothetical protein